MHATFAERKATITLLLWFFLCNQLCSIAEQIPSALREKLSLDPFYQKYADASGLPIVGSVHVRDEALGECAWIVRQMLSKRPDILQSLADARVRFAIMAHNEYTTDLPEQSKMDPKVYWDRRARGLGATPEVPVVSGGEENLLAFPGDPYPTEIIPLHEFAHAIHLVAMKAIDPSFDDRLKLAYERALNQGLWKGTYAAVNREEYWAESVQSWFDNNADVNALHNEVNTRDELLAYDPAAAALCREVFGDNPWRYLPPSKRPPEDREHLKSWEASQAPKFQWRDAAIPEAPRVSVETPLGIFHLRLHPTTAALGDTSPSKVAEPYVDFLKQVHAGWFSNASLIPDAGNWTVVASATGQGGIGVPPKTRWRLRPPQISNADLSPSGDDGERTLQATWEEDKGPKSGTAISVQRMVRRN